MARDDPGIPPLRHQLLIVPVLDARYVPEEGSCDPAAVPYESYVRLEFAPCLPLQRIRWFYNLWLGRGAERVERANDFRASPMAAKDLSNLAAASIHCAEVDPLVDEGKAYHEKLTAAGTSSVLKVYKGVGHPFGHWVGELPVAREFAQNVHAALREALVVI
jgi:acetyl esterase/lipase